MSADARYAARRDDNEKQIVKDLRKFGAKVLVIKKPCDLLVRWRQVNHLIDVTNPENKYRKRDPKQLETFEEFAIVVVSTLEEALLAIGAEF